MHVGPKGLVAAAEYSHGLVATFSLLGLLLAVARWCGLYSRDGDEYAVWRCEDRCWTYSIHLYGY